MRLSRVLAMALLGAAIALAAVAGAAGAATLPFINGFSTISTVASAVPQAGPAAGDQNPYGVAVVPRSEGKLVRGDVLVSNFNNAANQQGTGSSIVEISPSGEQRVFAVLPPAPGSSVAGLTTALAILPGDFVVVGALPAVDGMSANATAGALFILNSRGQVVRTISGGDIDGPWDMTAVSRHGRAILFVTNVLNGTVAADGRTIHDGTVVRLVLGLRGHETPVVHDNRVIATGFAEHTDPNALVVGPTGVGLGRAGILYVADSNGNRIAAIPDALTRMTALRGGGLTLTEGGALNDPLGLAIAPGGDVITANGGDGLLVETSPDGMQVATRELVPDGAGDLFGLAIAPDRSGLYFVNDSGSGPAANSLDLLH